MPLEHLSLSLHCWGLQSEIPEHSRTVGKTLGFLEEFQSPKDAWPTLHELHSTEWQRKLSLWRVWLHLWRGYKTAYFLRRLGLLCSKSPTVRIPILGPGSLHSGGTQGQHSLWAVGWTLSSESWWTPAKGFIFLVPGLFFFILFLLFLSFLPF